MFSWNKWQKFMMNVYLYFHSISEEQINKLILNIHVLQKKKKNQQVLLIICRFLKKYFTKALALLIFYWRKLMKHIIQKLYSAHIYHCAKHVNKHLPVYRNHKLRSCNTVKKHDITYSNEFDTSCKSHHGPIYKSTCN